VVTWNLRNFPDEHQDLELLRARLESLDADVIAVQEIKEPAALRALLPQWKLAISGRGGRGRQKLGVLYNPARVELVGEPAEHDELSLGGRVRPAFSAYLRARGGGPDFHLVVVHLKAMTEGYSQRAQQWPMLASIVGSLQENDRGGGDQDVLVVGDFNTTGPPGGDTAEELRALEDLFGSAGLRRLPSARGCSTYWDGPRRDAWQEPSLLDLVWVGDLAEAMGGDAQAAALGHCARHRCEAFRSTDAYPDLDFETVSDHCPVIVDLAFADDDP
jgi:endonuclease/exonuclease/phosphatase family metal-dependent hydrolase